MKKLQLIIYVFFIYSGLFSQNFNKYNYNHEAFFPTTEGYKPWGWLISPGITYTLTNPAKTDKTFNDTTFTFDPSGKIGLYLDAGLHRLFKNPGFFRSMDFGLAYKSLAGKEAYTNTLTQGAGTGSFNDQHGLAFFNLNNIIEISNPWFIQNSFGVNVDYQFAQDRVLSSGIQEKYPDKIIAQLHYKFSMGLFATKKLLIMPSIETPIIGFTPSLPKPYLEYFNSWYHPIIVSVRFVFLRPNKEECPPVYAPGLPDGFTPDGMGR